jgi:adsorption protein B
VLFGDLLQVRGLLPPSLFNQALIDFDPERHSLGQHLLQRGVIGEEVLRQALREQAEEQHESYRLVEALV